MIFVLLIISILFPFLYGYSFVITNQYTQIPIVLSYMNREYLLNDWYVGVSKDFGPRTFFALYTSLWGNLAGLPLTYILHYILSTFLILYATFRLNRFIFKNQIASLLSSITIIFSATYGIGGNLLITKDFPVTQLAIGLSLMGISLVIERKNLPAAVLFIISAYLHPLIGPLTGIISFISM